MWINHCGGVGCGSKMQMRWGSVLVFRHILAIHFHPFFQDLGQEWSRNYKYEFRSVTIRFVFGGNY